MKKPSKLKRARTLPELKASAQSVSATHALVARGQALVSLKGGYDAVARLASQFGLVDRMMKAQAKARRGELRERPVLLGPDGRAVGGGEREEAPRIVTP